MLTPGNSPHKFDVSASPEPNPIHPGIYFKVGPTFNERVVHQLAQQSFRKISWAPSAMAQGRDPGQWPCRAMAPGRAMAQGHGPRLGHGPGPWPWAVAQGRGPGPWPWAVAQGHGPGPWPWPRAMGQGPWSKAMAQGRGPGRWPWAVAQGHGPGRAEALSYRRLCCATGRSYHREGVSVRAVLRATT